jgi:tRNA (uracil-5-)-methyltransferase TRM9
MNKTLVRQLQSINDRFYQKNAYSFSQTRQSPWPGWQKLLSHIRGLPSPLSLLDLGCGNGRFGIFLTDSNVRLKSYVGIDENQALLEETKQSLKIPTRLHQANLLDFPSPLAPALFDLVAVFGVMHHIPGSDNRLLLLEKSASYVKPGGILAVSYWDYTQDPRFASRLIPWHTIQIDEKELDPGDYLLNWQQGEVPRFYHHTSEAEIAIHSTKIPLKIVDTYKEDGKSRNLNHYMVWKK